MALIQRPGDAPELLPQQDGETSLIPGLVLVAGGTVLAYGLASLVGPLSMLVAAVLIGAVIGNVSVRNVSIGNLSIGRASVGNSSIRNSAGDRSIANAPIGRRSFANPATQPGLSFAAKRVLRVGIVLLGLRLSLGDVAALGAKGLVVVAMTVAVTFFGTQWIGKRLGLSRDLSLLVATGYSICGASAIAAVEGSTDAEEEEVAAAIGLVTLFGSLAILALPALAGALNLTPDQFGAWAGASVHDVAQVVATASSGGASVIATATVVKLTRVALLAPIVAGVNIHRRNERGADGGRADGPGADGPSADGPSARSDAKSPPILPLFVVGFLTMVLVRTSGFIPTDVITVIKMLEGWILAAALVGLGSGVRIDRLRKLGPLPLVLGTIAWILVAAVSLLGITIII